jgi:6-pyruvoyl-tetrahydropterin synthase
MYSVSSLITTREDPLFAVEVRDHFMVAHSLRGALFGPAQKLHGATFVVDVAFIAERLDRYGLVVDIGKAHDAVKSVLERLNYSNLDDLRDFKEANTTTEFLASYIFEQMAGIARSGSLGRDGRELKTIRVTIAESHLARAWFEAPLW